MDYEVLKDTHSEHSKFDELRMMYEADDPKLYALLDYDDETESREAQYTVWEIIEGGSNEL